MTIGGGALLAGLTETIQNGLTMSGNFTIAAAHGQTLTTSTTNGWALHPSTGEVITFGTPGQDGTVLWSTPGSSTVSAPANNYTVLVQAGTLRGNDGNFFVLLYNDQHTTILSGATLDAAGFGLLVHDPQGGGHIGDSGGATSLVVNDGSFSGVIDGPLSLTVQGTLFLAGNNTYTGGTLIEAGATLTLAGGTTSWVPGEIIDNGTLEFRHANTFVEAGVISGSGNLVQSGSGTTSRQPGRSAAAVTWSSSPARHRHCGSTARRCRGTRSSISAPATQSISTMSPPIAGATPAAC